MDMAEQQVTNGSRALHDNFSSQRAVPALGTNRTFAAPPKAPKRKEALTKVRSPLRCARFEGLE
jgi:hypothetical protein